MTQIRDFLDQLASGNNLEAGKTLENELSSRAFDALDEYKKQVAQNLFGSNQETEESEE